MMDDQSILSDVAQVARSELDRGRVADYIPALASVPVDRFGISLQGEQYGIGHDQQPFSIQSVPKAFLLTLTQESIF